jgi:pSer/pThr/pTyr-binding forkhead associated (FHA) protein
MAAQFQLVMRAGPNAGKAFPLEASEISIGRDVGNTLVVSDAEVSRRHARLTWQGAGYFIEDVGSTNGTFVNGQRISAPHILKTGDLVSLSESIILAFEATGDASATMIASSRPADDVSPQTPPAPRRATAPLQQPASPAPQPVPAAPVPPPPARKKPKIWLILLLLVLCVACACVALFAAVDYLNLWCSPYLSWLTNIIGPIITGSPCLN